MINFELYKIFVIVANEKSISKAAQILHVSQSTIIKSIKNLEGLLQIKLFKKTSKGLRLSDDGISLYEKLKDPICEIINIDNQLNSLQTVNLGSHSHLLNKIFDKCLKRFSLENPNVNLNIINLDTNEMLELLNNKKLDIVFSKKIDYKKYQNLKYVKLGYLNDIFVINKNSLLNNKLLCLDDLENEFIFAPKYYFENKNAFFNFVDENKYHIKYTNLDTILDLVKSSSSIAILTKDYLDNNFLKNNDLVEANTNFSLEPVEFGFFVNNSNKFKELTNFEQIIKSHFFFEDFKDD